MGTEDSRVSSLVGRVVAALALATATAATPAIAALVTPPADARIVNFDDVGNAPGSFSNAPPLRLEYTAVGVDFSGPGLDGGALLAENGSFSISGFSPPNVMAFNVAGTLNNGGKPKLPQTLRFRHSASRVQFNVGDTSGLTITAEAFDEANNSLDIENVVPTNAMQTIVLEARHIAKVVISGGGLTTIVDDVAFVIDTTVIDFDDAQAPGSFDAAKALRREFIGEGFESVHINLNDGAAVLNSTSGFNVTGFSPPNFLAVDNASGLIDGGIPKFPLYLQFFPPVTRIEFLVGDADQSTVTAVGSYYGGPAIDTAVVAAEAAMKPVVLDGGAMTFVEITSTGTRLALDDLQFLADGIKIDFDDYANAPLSFDEATAIRDRYLLLGIKFRSPGANDGMALLGNNTFGVTGLSGTNFLAFDAGATLGSGGTAQLPEIIRFEHPVERVDLFVGSNQGTRIFAEGRDAAGDITATNDVITTPGMQVLPLYFEGTTNLTITATGNVGVIDNLTFKPMAPCPFDLCYQGDTLNRYCNECATIICAQDSNCCNDGWDLSCAVSAEATCELTCGPLCGDANEDRKVTAPDALAALKTSIGTATCPAFRCDFNGQAGVKSGDALLILKTAVGQETDPNCPPEPI